MKLYKRLFFVSLAAVLSSCTLVDLEDPLKGQVTLATDWSHRSPGVEIPGSYTVAINNQTLEFTGTTNLLPALEAGVYPVHVYTVPEKISVSGTTATVTSIGNAVDPLPGWLFTAVTEASYANFGKETITAVMEQQMRALAIVLKPEGGTVERIGGITATLSGVAGAWDFNENQPVGNAMEVPLRFTKQGDGTWQATVRLLGITGTGQTLSGTIAFTDGAPADMTLESDLSALLAGFNADKRIPLSLQGEMEKTTSEAGLSATINKWISTPGSSGTAW